MGLSLPPEWWPTIDRLDNYAAVPKRRGNKKMLRSKPDPKTKPHSKKARRREKKLKEKADHRMMVNASKAVGWVRVVAAARFDPAGERAYRDHKLGTFGAASEVKRNPAEYLAAKARGEP